MSDDNQFLLNHEGDTATALILGNVTNAEADEYRTRLVNTLPTVNHLVLKLGGVGFMDSAGLGFLVALKREADKAGVTIELNNVPSSVKKLLDITKLTEAFKLTT